MTLAACLMLFAAVASVIVPRVLRRSGAGANSPRLGVAVWLAAVGSVTAAWLAAAGIVVAEALTALGTGGFAEACLALLRGGRLDSEILAAIGPVVAAVLLPVLLIPAVRTGRVIAATLRTQRKLTRALRLVGRPAPDLGSETLILDSLQREAYCLSGGTGTVVVTTGALDALRPDEVHAVLAHERAHLAGRHHALLTLLAALRRGAPGVALFAEAEQEVARLLEMCADDVAARRHGSVPLVSALLAMSGGMGTPRGALGAGGPSALIRARRLLNPATATQRVETRVTLAALTAGVVVSGVAPLGLMVSQLCTSVLA